MKQNLPSKFYDEIIKNYGVEKMKAIITGAANEIEFALLREHSKYDVASDEVTHIGRGMEILVLKTEN